MPYKNILAAAPGEVRQASGYQLPIAHMAYRVGSGLGLRRGSLGLSVRNGLMALGDYEYDGSDGDVGLLCDEVLRECAQRGFEGIVLDFEKLCDPLITFVAMLTPAARRRGLTVYLHERYAGFGDGAVVLVSATVTSGSLRGRLESAASRYGGQRIAIEVEMSARDMAISHESGNGNPISPEELRRLLSVLRPAVFYSRELFAHYFTYKEDGLTHFVLFDNAESLARKLCLARSMNLAAGFMLYPEVEDILPEIIRLI